MCLLAPVTRRCAAVFLRPRLLPRLWRHVSARPGMQACLMPAAAVGTCRQAGGVGGAQQHRVRRHGETSGGSFAQTTARRRKPPHAAAAPQPYGPPRACQPRRASCSQLRRCPLAWPCGSRRAPSCWTWLSARRRSSRCGHTSGKPERWRWRCWTAWFLRSGKVQRLFGLSQAACLARPPLCPTIPTKVAA